MKTVRAADAERLALNAFHFIAEDRDRLSAFLNASGLDPAALRDQAHTTSFLVGLLDYLLSDESLLLTPACVALGGAPDVGR